MADRAEIDGGQSGCAGWLAIIGLAFGLVVVIVSWGLWSFFHTVDVSYRYRLTVSIEADGRLHTGSSVLERMTKFYSKAASQMVGGSPGHTSLRGQGILIDLGEHGVLVVALYGPRGSVSASDLFGRVFDPVRPDSGAGYPLSLENERALAQKQGRFDLTSDNLPAFFWFSDKTNPATAQLVKPESFTAVIGDSTRLVSAQIEITHDPVVIDFDKTFPAYAVLAARPKSYIYTPNDISAVQFVSFEHY